MESIPDPKLILGIESVFFVVILLICGLLSAAEKSITLVNRNQIRTLADSGNGKAKRLVKLLAHPSVFLSSALITTIFLGFLASGMFVQSATSSLGKVFLERGFAYGTPAAILILTILVSCLFSVLAILYPRQLAVQHTQGVALTLSGYAYFFSKLCLPFVKISEGLTNLILRMTRQHICGDDETFSEEEVMSMLEVGKETGVLKEEGKKMIDSIFAFDDKLAYEVMTPRTDVFAIDIQDETEEYLDELMELRYSRIPVYDEDSDNIIGILNIKDYLIKAREDGFENVELKGILRKPFFVPDTKNIDGLFFELQKTKQHIAILIDEYGGFSGIVTMEDLIEEVMGNIDDEYDEEEAEIEKIDAYNYYIDGYMNLDDINEELGVHLESDNCETLGGLLIDILGEIPDEEDKEERIVQLEQYTFIIESVKDRRIERVKLTIAPEHTQVEADEKEESVTKEEKKEKKEENG
ncbi:MAG: hemolysin family protein [Anaerovoracaceae bacterium]